MGKSLLILGNGFDLAHGLPTRYADFLEFCNTLKALSTFRKDKKLFISTHIENKKFNKRIIEFFSDEFDNRTCCSEGRWIVKNKNAVELLLLLDSNIWYNYLYGLYEKNKFKGENWIDFESEICYIIRILDKGTENLSHSYEYVSHVIRDMPEVETIDFIEKFVEFNKLMNAQTDPKNSIKELRKTLYDDLRKLTCALELYLNNFLDYSQCKPLLDIMSIEPDYIINFNYTSTYEKVYNNSTNVCYIHGTCNEQSNIETNNMVLGIDEYWSDEEKDFHTNFTIFKKFAQRIQKRTSVEFRRIHSEMKDEINVQLKTQSFDTIHIENEMPVVYIFGHSLDITDKDILKLFLGEDMFNIKIFCRDYETEGEYIANVIKIIGEDKLIEKVNNFPPQIEFVIQQDMQTAESEKTNEQECLV